ncbi:phosphate transport system regulatory protein PhoU [Haloferula helveola]|uniref:Phosphate-specific transport system accessory protein PhoU n=1 Tax=Haloferula helveola TaxID=490095 RepID=A0ABM7RNW0_9BACT|nr:phosphate transport system regulatory protein PhoU [Haloferula helveola]
MNSQASHYLGDFDSALQALRSEVFSMADMAKHNIDRAIRALVEQDLDLCRTVIADDNEVDEAERRVDRMGMEAIARFKPVATDLRMVISSMKISTNLERVSDHAVGIAKRVRKILRCGEVAEFTYADLLYSMASSILADAVASYADGNVELGASLSERDKELDRAYKRCTNSLSDSLGRSEGNSELYLHLIFILRSLERIGDLAVNIGEDAVFMEAARDIRHGHALDEEPMPENQG